MKKTIFSVLLLSILLITSQSALANDLGLKSFILSEDYENYAALNAKVNLSNWNQSLELNGEGSIRVSPKFYLGFDVEFAPKTHYLIDLHGIYIANKDLAFKLDIENLGYALSYDSGTLRILAAGEYAFLNEEEHSLKARVDLGYRNSYNVPTDYIENYFLGNAFVFGNYEFSPKFEAFALAGLITEKCLDISMPFGLSVVLDADLSYEILPELKLGFNYNMEYYIGGYDMKNVFKLGISNFKLNTIEAKYMQYYADYTDHDNSFKNYFSNEYRSIPAFGVDKRYGDGTKLAENLYGLYNVQIGFYNGVVFEGEEDEYDYKDNNKLNLFLFGRLKYDFNAKLTGYLETDVRMWWHFEDFDNIINQYYFLLSPMMEYRINDKFTISAEIHPSFNINRHYILDEWYPRKGLNLDMALGAEYKIIEDLSVEVFGEIFFYELLEETKPEPSGNINLLLKYRF